jgi:predicted PurR-regulated permease PerM
VGVIVLLGGFADFKSPITDLYSFIYAETGILISLMVIAALSYVIIAIINESIKIINNKNKRDIENYEKISEQRPKYGEKIDHWLDKKDDNINDSNLNDDTKNDHDMR